MQALDSRLDGLMLVVRLQYLVAREGGWGAQAEWGETLSLGTPPPSPLKVAEVWLWKERQLRGMDG